jgi:CO/xanthine dehydrogenase Mo-binding subunit
MSSYIGQSLKRFEDPRLLKGQGTFVDDMQLPGGAFPYFRSTYERRDMLALNPKQG